MSFFKKISVFAMSIMCLFSFGVVASGCTEPNTILSSIEKLKSISRMEAYSKFIPTTKDTITDEIKTMYLTLDQTFNASNYLTSGVIGDKTYQDTYDTLYSTCLVSVKGFNLFYQTISNAKILENAQSEDIAAFRKVTSSITETFDAVMSSYKLVVGKPKISPSTSSTDAEIYNTLTTALNTFIKDTSALSVATINIFNNNLDKLKLSINELSSTMVSGQYEATVLKNYYNSLAKIIDLSVNNKVESYFSYDRLNTLSQSDTYSKGSALQELKSLNDKVISQTYTLHKINYDDTAVSGTVSFNRFKEQFLSKKPSLENYKLKEKAADHALTIVNIKEFSTVIVTEKENKKVDHIEYIKLMYDENQKNSYNFLVNFLAVDMPNNIANQLTIISTCA